MGAGNDPARKCILIHAFRLVCQLVRSTLRWNPIQRTENKLHWKDFSEDSQILGFSGCQTLERVLSSWTHSWKLRLCHESFSGIQPRKRRRDKADHNQFNGELFIGTFAVIIANHVVNLVNIDMDHIVQPWATEIAVTWSGRVNTADEVDVAGRLVHEPPISASRW
jgi:hypothetical protein